jgi:hypothetical protein
METKYLKLEVSTGKLGYSCNSQKIKGSSKDDASGNLQIQVVDNQISRPITTMKIPLTKKTKTMHLASSDQNDTC